MKRDMEINLSTLDNHYQAIGRILENLVSSGLRRIDFEPGDAFDILPEPHGDEDEVYATFTDVLTWMIDEGIIRAAKVQSIDDISSVLSGVQLTSKGIAIMQARPIDGELPQSIEKTLAEGKKGELSSDVYTKIGSIIGGAAGGFLQSISGG